MYSRTVVLKRKKLKFEKKKSFDRSKIRIRIFHWKSNIFQNIVLKTDVFFSSLDKVYFNLIEPTSLWDEC